jgi:ABC-type transporter Mla MlaB component
LAANWQLRRRVPFSITNHPGRQVLKLEGAVTIRHIQDLVSMLGDDREDGRPLHVDTADLLDIDTCALQLLCSLRKSAPAVSFAKPSAAFIASVERCGLRRELLTAREGL